MISIDDDDLLDFDDAFETNQTPIHVSSGALSDDADTLLIDAKDNSLEIFSKSIDSEQYEETTHFDDRELEFQPKPSRDRFATERVELDCIDSTKSNELDKPAVFNKAVIDRVSPTMSIKSTSTFIRQPHFSNSSRFIHQNNHPFRPDSLMISRPSGIGLLSNQSNFSHLIPKQIGSYANLLSGQGITDFQSATFFNSLPKFNQRPLMNSFAPGGGNFFPDRQQHQLRRPFNAFTFPDFGLGQFASGLLAPGLIFPTITGQSAVNSQPWRSTQPHLYAPSQIGRQEAVNILSPFLLTSPSVAPSFASSITPNLSTYSHPLGHRATVFSPGQNFLFRPTSASRFHGVFSSGSLSGTVPGQANLSRHSRQRAPGLRAERQVVVARQPSIQHGVSKTKNQPQSVSASSLGGKRRLLDNSASISPSFKRTMPDPGQQ
ncbi:unnamed protein product [Protopolystoma xenopodis]|uniref:Uncharacterized protein n=1 Tax=Protopolystoma xenopodis TaxID=117903 RepID=A0A448XFP6_9PLAT|nr:unnamed protein product [Protopolystoma xenopodis]